MKNLSSFLITKLVRFDLFVILVHIVIEMRPRGESVQSNSTASGYEDKSSFKVVNPLKPKQISYNIHI